MDTLQQTQEQELYTQSQRDKLFDFNSALPELKKLIDGWSDECTKSKKRREFRRVDVDVDAERNAGNIDKDEIILPVRVVDENIEKEMPSYVAYLTQAQNLIIFKDILKPSTDTANLSADFSSGMKYLEWEKTWFRCIDGAELHGTDAIEVLYDTTKPLNVGLEHVGHDSLFFARDTLDIQDCPFVIRKYAFSADKLRDSVKNNRFDAEGVKELLDKIKNDAENSTEDVYKVYFKFDGFVYIAWFSLNCTEKWLKAPEKLFVGVNRKVESSITINPGEMYGGLPYVGTQPLVVPKIEFKPEYETMYPIFLLSYKETEEKKLTDKKGRAFYDQYRQEGQTSIISGYVNALNRSTSFIASPKAPTGSGTSPKQTQTSVGPGMFSEPMDVTSLPYPDSVSILGALQYLDAANAREINQLTEVLRRKKGEKTAKEVSVAERETGLLEGVKLVLFSTFIRKTYTYVWRIVQSQAIQGLIPLLVVEVKEGKYINDESIISRAYIILSAGDVEVVQRAQKLDRMMQFWPVAATTSLRDVFFIKLVRILFPDDAKEYEAVFQANNVGKQLLQQVSAMLVSVLQAHPEELQTLPPEQVKQMQVLQQQVQQYLQTP